MRYEPDKIEEKLIPFIEGVLNPREHREVEEAINSNSQLAREVTDLREVIEGLREGFAAGIKPPQERLTPDEVVELSLSGGGVESLRGSSEQKAKLFCSDDALEELALLRALQEELSRTTLDTDNAPPLPDSLRAEFQRLDAGSAKVIPLVRKLSPVPIWRRASQFLDRIDPKPLMASAAALMMLSLGVHYHNQSSTNQAPSAQVASTFQEDERGEFGAGPTPAASASEPGTLEEKADATDALASTRTDKSKEPSGVAVFTSDDSSLLKEQAGKLLAGKVRYTVTEDRILVADKDVKAARGILWDAPGEEIASNVGDYTRQDNKDSEETERNLKAPPAPPKTVRAKPTTTTSGGRAAPGYTPRTNTRYPSPEAPMVPSTAKKEVAPGVVVYKPAEDEANRKIKRGVDKPAKLKEIPAYSKKAATRGKAGVLNSYNEPAPPPPASGNERSALQSKSSTGVAAKPPARPTATKGGLPTGEGSMVADLQPKRTVESDRDALGQAKQAPVNTERRSKLRELAMGKDVKVKAPVVEEVTSEQEDGKNWDVPVVAQAPEPVRSVPKTVAKARPKARKAPSAASKMGPPRRTQNITRARTNDYRQQEQVAPVANAVTIESPDRRYENQSIAMKSAPSDAGGDDSAGGSTEILKDTRVASIRSSQAAVARRHNVTLSVTSSGGKVTVYVRPNSKLTKAELNALRSAIRRDLNLAGSDTIVIN